MKTKKMLVFFIVLLAVMLVLIPKVHAGGGSVWYVYIYDDEDSIYFEPSNDDYYFELEDFKAYIAEINKHLPEGVFLKANEDKTYDVYMNNVNCNKNLSFYWGWSGKLYVSGNNYLDGLELMATKIDIIGNGLNELNVDGFLVLHTETTFENCNINFGTSEPRRIFLYAPTSIKGRVKIKIAPNTNIFTGVTGDYKEEIVKNFISDNYNDEYVKLNEIYNINSYCSPETIIIKNYDDVDLLEQSVEKINAGEGLTFRFDKEIEKFEDLYINGNLLEKDVDYTIESGSTIVKLSAEYTKTLAAGNYEVKAIFTDGEGSTTFEVLEENKVEESNTERTLDKTPKTGSKNNTYYILISVLVIITLGITLNKFI